MSWSGDRFFAHVEKCDYCQYLEEHAHPQECPDCGHNWHQGFCDAAFGEEDSEHGGICPCQETLMMTYAQVEAEQSRHADEAAEAAYDHHINQKLAEWKERGL